MISWYWCNMFKKTTRSIQQVTYTKNTWFHWTETKNRAAATVKEVLHPRARIQQINQKHFRKTGKTMAPSLNTTSRKSISCSTISNMCIIMIHNASSTGWVSRTWDNQTMPKALKTYDCFFLGGCFTPTTTQNQKYLSPTYHFRSLNRCCYMLLTVPTCYQLCGLHVFLASAVCSTRSMASGDASMTDIGSSWSWTPNKKPRDALNSDTQVGDVTK